MTNQDVAAKLREVHDLMQLNGENRFKVIAFDRAAQTIEGLKSEVETHVKEGTLTDIKGIGKSIAEDITRWLKPEPCRFWNPSKRRYQKDWWSGSIFRDWAQRTS